ncbi:MAG: hypothetical protein IJJ69_03220 [Oscillospiraceae bacterium]|nr:hypothetical protein [Oscillospiraceae bacterium]
MNTSIYESETIVNSLKEKNLHELFSAHVMKHLMTILIAVFSIRYHGKTVDFANHSDCHRTTLGHFLNHGIWDETILETAVRMAVLSIIYGEAKRSGKPVLCIVDDTISSKTVPSSKAELPIEAADINQSQTNIEISATGLGFVFHDLVFRISCAECNTLTTIIW